MCGLCLLLWWWAKTMCSPGKLLNYYSIALMAMQVLRGQGTVTVFPITLAVDGDASAGLHAFDCILQWCSIWRSDNATLLPCVVICCWDLSTQLCRLHTSLDVVLLCCSEELKPLCQPMAAIGQALHTINIAHTIHTWRWYKSRQRQRVSISYRLTVTSLRFSHTNYCTRVLQGALPA